MKQEKVIELALDAGFGNYAFEAAGVFKVFADAVEQESIGSAIDALNRIEDEEPDEDWRPGYPSKALQKLQERMRNDTAN